MNLIKLLRPEIKDFQPYLPGKPIEEVQKEYCLKKIIKLASNENALGTSKKALTALNKNHKNLFRYPESAGTLLRRSLAKHWKVKETEVILGAGSDELVELLAKTFFNRQDEIIVSEHAFIRYKMAADLVGAKTISVPMKNFICDLPEMAKKIGRRTKAIFIANPNNPTGTYVTKQEVKTFFSFLKKSRFSTPLVIFDEAYYEYAKEFALDYPELLSYFQPGFNLVILRTFSKIYGLAGLRIGYGIAHEEMIKAMDRVRPPFNVSSLAQLAGISALSDSTHLQKSLDIVKKGLDYLTHHLARLNLRFIPTAANFLLIDLFPHKGKEIFEKLLKRGVIVRAMDEYDFPHHIRVTIGLPEENQFFLHYLEEVIAEK